MLKVQKTLFDLDSMSEVTCTKEFEFSPVTSTQEALQRIGGDAKKFLEIINEGLEGEAQRSAKNDNSIPWMVTDDEGTVGEFSGTPADSKAVNNLVLTLAKTVFGYTKDSDIEQRRAAKEKALEMIKSTEAIRNGLKESAAA